MQFIVRQRAAVVRFLNPSRCRYIRAEVFGSMGVPQAEFKELVGTLTPCWKGTAIIRKRVSLMLSLFVRNRTISFDPRIYEPMCGLARFQSNSRESGTSVLALSCENE